MPKLKALSPEEIRERADFRERFARALAERPEMSDEEFMAETEVSDEEYATGFVLPVNTDSARRKK